MHVLTLASSRRFAALFPALILCMLGARGMAAGTPTGQPVVYAITPNNTLTEIDTGNHQILRTITLAGPAGGIVGTPDGKQLYVTGYDPTKPANSEGVVYVIDTQTYTVKATLPLNYYGIGMVISPDGSRVYVLDAYPDVQFSEVTVIDTATNTEVTAIANSAPAATGIAISPDGTKVYVPMFGGKDGYGALDVIATANNALQSVTVIPYEDEYNWVAVSPDSSKLYSSLTWTDEAGDQGGGNYIIDASTYQPRGTFTLPANAQLSTPLPNSNLLYGTSGGSILVFSTETDAVVATIPVATSIQSLAVTPDSKQLYVSNSNTQSIAIIDPATNTVTGSVAVAGATGMTIVAAPPALILTPPVVTLQVSPTSVPPGADQATLSWTSTGTTSCTASGGWSGSMALQGSVAAPAVTAAGIYTYTLTCTGPGGTTAASARLTVVPGSTLSFSNGDIPVNTTTVLSWKGFAGAAACEATGTWSGDLPASGSQVVGPYSGAGTHAFTLYCSAASGDGYDTVTKSLSVFAPGPTKYTALVPPNDNVNAVAVAGKPATGGGLDGHGYAYNSQDPSLPKPLTAFGQTFALGSASTASGISNQTIALGSVQLENLTFLATAVNANQLNQPFVVTYSDGTTTTYKQSLSQWGSPQNYAGETWIASLSYRITPTGATQQGPWFIYAYQMTLDPTKTAISLKLPVNRDVIVLALNETKAPTAASISLSSAYNVTGLAATGHAATGGGLDNHGYAFESSLLPTGFTGAGQKFTMGPANQPDAVSNSTITLPAATRVGLTVLATAVNANQPNQTFLVTYQDGSSTTFTQGVSQWGSPQNYAGELDARSTAYRITPAGAQQAGAWHVYAYTFLTDPNKQIVSLTLPKNRDVVAFAVNSLTQ